MSKEHGCRIIGVIERDIAFHDPKGLDLDLIKSWMAESRQKEDFPNPEQLKSREEVFAAECDIFIPAAQEGTVTEENHNQLNAKIICRRC